MSNAAIYFHPEGYETARADLKGRHVAGESFLIGFFRHSGLDGFACHIDRPELAHLFTDLAARHAPGRRVTLYPTSEPSKLANVGCLFVPGPGIDHYAWRRRSRDQRGYSLCGITHTTSESPEHLGALATAPLQSWDAVICTSQAARASVEAVLRPYAAYLRDRLGAAEVPMPNLPVVPLGVDTAAFRFDPSVRAAERAALGIGPGEVAVLFMGRLSFHAKAHPVPMYLALEQAARLTGKRIHLIQAGWFGNDAIAAAFAEGAKRYCPSVNAIFLDGRKPEVRTRVWAAADLFTSLVDNIQETFGITPVEAMAAGLPCVVTDWNGYRETVRDGVDGFRVPTILPPPGAGVDLADRYAAGLDNYDHYIGRASQISAVDVHAAAEAYTRLVADEGLRLRMGEAGRARAVALFDWRAIIPQYLDVWRQLADIRRNAPERAPRASGEDGNPLRPDPLRMFQSYPTRALEPGLRLVRTDGASRAAIGNALAVLQADPLNSPARGILSPAADLVLALDALDPPGRTVGELTALVPPERQLLLVRSLVHLMKFGLLRTVEPLAVREL
ncbi:glycosyltransferase involved in cell wall biosynthesis [Azospirillum brasilense]|uniref:Glycosyltransferase involved in cell wall biosynthesis n=1 Tax=Azospirillum brasilense TaxID=192 RepID=A0A560BWP7_AZOBR|nr:glycosyltransferase family 4 protein [Azospirillum brasilense]MBK3734746.1 glycosyltransferase [Azospirillum brasilense]TWA77035.1 glycosyltransferase involved in cell wall biosynthesis [Azospirillum brasilense]